MKRLTAQVLTFLLLTAAPLAASSLGSPRSATELPEEFTTVFPYGDSAFGVLNPTDGTIITVSFDGRIQRNIKLRGNVESPAGPVYPDQVQRGPDGRIYWLKKRIATIAVFSDDGTLESTIATNLPAPFWFAVANDRSVTVYGSSEFAPVAQYVNVSYDRKVRTQRPGWLRPSNEYNSFASAISGSTYNCQSSTCPNSASCDGTYYSVSGCTYQCYNGGTGGLITPAGSATCGSSGGGRVQNPTP
jgi:hypothetical protein